MSGLICRKTMMPCTTTGMCSPYGGCQPELAMGHDSELIDILEELIESAEDGAVHKGEYLSNKYKEPELFRRAHAKLESLRARL